MVRFCWTHSSLLRWTAICIHLPPKRKPLRERSKTRKDALLFVTAFLTALKPRNRSTAFALLRFYRFCAFFTRRTYLIFLVIGLKCKLSSDEVKFPICFLWLPACFLHAGDLTLVSKLSEADSANTELTQISVRSAADLASVVSTSGELRRSLLLLL